MGSHKVQKEGRSGVYFSVWAPNAKEVSVIGNFNGWDSQAHQLFWRWDDSGIWEGFIEGLDWEMFINMVSKTYSGHYLEKRRSLCVTMGEFYQCWFYCKYHVL